VAPSGGETYADVQVRVRDWYDQLETDTVAVAHGGTARALMVSLGLETPASAAELFIEQGAATCFATAGWRSIVNPYTRSLRSSCPACPGHPRTFFLGVAPKNVDGRTSPAMTE